MDINDKLGRDRATELMNTFKVLCGDKEGVEDIVKGTNMYQLFSGKGERPSFTSTDGTITYPARTYKISRSSPTNKILHMITLKQYLAEGVIDDIEYANLNSMLNSPDVDNASMVEMLLEAKYRPAWQKQRNQLKRKLKKFFNGIH